MILKSIKWRLQLWYGLILVAVLVGFGATAHQLERNRLLRKVDDELHSRIGVLASALHRPPPHGPDADGPVFGGPPPGQFPDVGPPLRRNRPPPEFRLPPNAAQLFDNGDPHGFYFRIISLFDHKEIARSTNQPPIAVDKILGGMNPDDDIPTSGPRLLRGQMIAGSDYFMLDSLPSGEEIFVGCSIAPELTELYGTAINLTVFGGFILLVGIAGGWWFVGRALRPISEISSTATKISAGDLSQRINSAETESELGQLVAVLNSTFARLETAFAQQKQFASDAAHELRTPVSVILTQTQMALKRERDAAGYKQTIEACQRAAQRMRKLIESLLELARFDAGQEVLKRLDFDLVNAIAECAELVQPLAEERKVKIISELKQVKITGDSGRLAQVITNLLTNAIQFSQPGDEVRVKLEAQGGLAVLEISDTGEGIATEDLPHVFERFYRADKSRTGAGNSGLGLAICKAIVEAHGGTIEVSSVETAGTSFVVRLPVAD